MVRIINKGEFGSDAFGNLIETSLNMRFTAFLARLGEHYGIDASDIYRASERIMEAAEIHQDA